MRTIALLSILACATAVGAAAAPAPPQGHPLAPGVWQLDGFDPTLGTGDLAPLRSVIGNATVVGLGESFHTSGGFHDMKDRLLRYLVSTLGFRLFAIESPWVAADSTAAYVDSCGGTPEAALEGLFGVWQSAEVAAMVQWMCEWNRSHPRARDKVHFMGFDIQEQSAEDMAALVPFLERLGLAASDPRLQGLASCVGDDPNQVVTASDYAACSGSLTAISDYFSANASLIIRRTSSSDFAWAKLRLAGLRAWEDEEYFFFLPQGPDYRSADKARDHGMAYTLLELRALRYRTAKTVVWAHNTHLALDGPGNAHDPYVNMGLQLHAWLGGAYLPLALASADTEADWPSVICGMLSFGHPGSYEAAADALGGPALLIDLRVPGVVPNSLPAGVHRLGFQEIDIRQQYGGLVYLSHSPKMTPLEWPPCTP